MQINTFTEDSTLIMKVSGRLDTMTAPELEKKLNTDCLDGITKLVMDFSDLEYISSAGLRVLLIAAKKMKGNGSFAVRNLNEIVKEVLDVTGFLDILTVE